MEDLGTLPGDLRSAAAGINDSGTIAGVSYGAGTAQHAVRWDGIKKLADLGFDSWAAAINRDNVVVGYAVNAAGQAQAVKWLPSSAGFAAGDLSSQATRWDYFTGGAETLAPAPSSAAEVNNSGVVAGTVGTSAATWDMGGTRTVLPSLSGAARHSVTGLSEVGQVIGVATFANGTYRAVVWR